MQDFVKINKEDKVAVALKPLAKGAAIEVDGEQVTLLEDIPQGHKFALCAIKAGEAVKERGLNLLSAPGNDLVASTALAVSGAQIVLFTTGRGTPFATLVPTMKISSNSKLAGFKSNWIDFNAGRMVEDMTKEQAAEELFNYVLRVASGEKVKSEAAGFHDIAIFKQGVTL